jgi:hypothetical protein
MSISELNQELDAAKAVRTELLASLGDEYNPGAMEQLQIQQQRIASLTTQLAAAEAAAVAAVAPVVHSSGTAIVSILSGGKLDKTLQVPSGTLLGDVMDELGWTTAGYTFNRRLGVGQRVTLTNWPSYVLSEGTHEISLAPAVEAG